MEPMMERIRRIPRFWVFAIYPALCLVGLVQLLVWAAVGGAQRSPGHGLGESWLVFFSLLSLPCYGLRFGLLARSLQRLETAGLVTAAVVATIGTPAIAAGGWLLGSHVFSTHSALADFLYFGAPAGAGLVSVPLAYFVAAAITTDLRARAA
jgi:hypothetical protein